MLLVQNLIVIDVIYFRILFIGAFLIYCFSCERGSLTEFNEKMSAMHPYNFSWIVPGKLAGMSCPDRSEHIEFLIQNGIHHLVTLSSDRMPADRGILQWSLIAVEEFEPPTLQQIGRFIEICENSHWRGEAVGVHCRQGLGRTGVMLASYLVHFENCEPHDAIKTVREQRPWSIETDEQEDIIFAYYNETRRKNLLDL